MIVTGGLIVTQAAPAQAVYPCRLKRMVNYTNDRAYMQTWPYDNGSTTGICTVAKVRHVVQPPSGGGAHWTSWVGYAGSPGWYTIMYSSGAQLQYGQTCRGASSSATCYTDSYFTNTSWQLIGP